MINFIKTDSPDIGIDDLSKKIIELILNSKRVLWLICGGSNLPIAVEVMNVLRENLSEKQLGNLTIMQTDERYGPLGHVDSNWQQLKDLKFSIHNIKTIPILRNIPLKETISEYGKDFVKIMEKTDVVIGQLGIGPDGHIAGILPHSPVIEERNPVCGYEGKPFTRVSLSFQSLERINYAYVFAFGSTKKEPIDNIRNKNLSLEEDPAQILKKIPEVHFYTDVI